ncbi:MAG: TonB-dependent receptor [Verrucomicrobia bacterium]|nr:MAG: TonB-dependent receptor [Verrucomicrobiota bacterium]
MKNEREHSMNFQRLIAYSIFTWAVASSATAHEPTGDTVELDPFDVFGRSEPLVGTALTASEGQVGSAELAARPFLRRGELLEVIPGLVVTQHAGGGKANQYFLRGFNLDHGTDFSVNAEGVPVNMPTHGHGQGYADVNFVVPEFVEKVGFNKGPFFAEVGDFSAAGASDIHFFSRLPRDFVTVTVGEDNFYRGVAGMVVPTGDGSGALSIGGELSYYDGPWVDPENFRRVNFFARHHTESDNHSITFTGLAYDAEWNSSDQIPMRAVEDGRIPRMGTADPTAGGESSRYGFTFQGAWRQMNAETRVNLFATRYTMDLFSNFTYFLDNPDQGDQFEQVDKRWVIGGRLDRDWRFDTANRPSRVTAGVQWRSDLIDEVGLHKAVARKRTSTVRSDEVDEHAIGLFGEYSVELSDGFRMIAGARGDFYFFDVESDLAANSGSENDFIASPKLNLVYTVAEGTELYLGGGFGFHSNDARGTTITIDPATGEPAERVNPLVRSRGLEGGVRFGAVRGVVSTLALFYLEVDSELLFVGDAGNTEASGASRRYGLELANFWQPLEWLAVDFDLALTNARFKDAGDEDHIPGSIDTVVSGGIVVGQSEGWFGSLRGRYFGPRTLVEDGSVEGESSFLTNLKIGYRTGRWEFAGEVLNLFDREDNDIEYYYESRLPGEPAQGIADIHFHPAEPRTFRLSATFRL